MILFPRRSLSALLVLWLALYLSVPQLLMPCSEHFGTGEAAAVTDVTAGHHDSHQQESAPQSDEGSHTCCCPGASCGSSAMAELRGVAIPAPESVLRAARIDAHATRPALGVTAHLLPFSTAPPASRA